MSPHPDESGPEPDDRLFVRPYVAASDGPSGAHPVWPMFPEPDEAPTVPLPRVSAAPPADPAARALRPEPRRRSSRLPLAGLALLALAGTGLLVFLIGGSEPETEPSSGRPDLALPALPARSPGAGEPDVRSQAAGASPSAAKRSPSPSSSSAKPSTSAATGTPTTPGTGSGTLRPGDKGPEVRALQERLYEQGFTYVRVTGVYDSQTKRGVSQLQHDRDIKGDPNGVYGPATRAAFG
ncbi:peptidoglycan-binding domain-containing protein [Streptomyces sp. NPDC029216]|uniref:peptidoglycan-binding domain-containing protein n=1 Tax=Streptomyces sp. NPDC029216 TaxID=3154701 RepID=UPI0033F7ECE6